MRAASALVLLLAFAPTSAAAQAGLSARFGYVRAVEREPLFVRVEVEGLLELVEAVVVEARREGEERWHSERALPGEKSGWFEATFTSTIVPERPDLTPRSIEIRARVIGTRAGTLIDLGEDEPLTVEVLSAPEARARDVVTAPLRRADDPDADLGLIGWIGADARLGTSARLRASIGLGLRVSSLAEAIVHVSVGPAFARPALLAGGGPVVLGVAGAFRTFARDVRLELWSPWIELAMGADLRLPGVDPMAGARAGLTFNVSGDVAVDVSLGGSLVVYRVIDPEERSRVGGATGGLRLELRFGGGR